MATYSFIAFIALKSDHIAKGIPNRKKMLTICSFIGKYINGDETFGRSRFYAYITFNP